MGIVRALLLADTGTIRRMIEFVIWYSAKPVVFGALLITADLFFVVQFKRKFKQFRNDPLPSQRVTVALTAYNDEESIAASVRDFIESPLVVRVIVISNNSTDRTAQRAAEAGAIVHNESMQGYGACVVRALREASSFTDTELVVLCEGDMAFRSYDLPKLLASFIHRACGVTR